MKEIMKKWFGAVDMTEGTPWKKIVTFAVPMLIGNIAQQLYNTVDSIVVGRYVGDNALAAVGSAGNIFYMMIVLFIGIGTGATIMVSQYLGARRKEELANTVGSSILLVAAAGLIIMIFGSLLIRPMLVLLKTPESLIPDAQLYLTILCLGSLAPGYYNIMSGILRGLGDSVSALLYLLVSCGLNIVGDLFCVLVLHMGVAGVAVATVGAQAVSAILCLIKLTRMKDYFVLTRKELRFQKSYFLQIIKLGLPAGLTEAVFSAAMLVVQPLKNGFGETFIAANSILMRVDGFMILPPMSFSTALTTYAGQNMGAGRIDRVQQGARQGIALSFIMTAVLTAIAMVFGIHLMNVFTNTPELAQLAMHLMRILMLGYLIMPVMEGMNGIMRGCGDAVTPLWITLFTTVIFQIPFVYLMCYLTRTPEMPHGNQDWVLLATTISWVAGGLLSIIAFSRGKWKSKSIVG